MSHDHVEYASSGEDHQYWPRFRPSVSISFSNCTLQLSILQKYMLQRADPKRLAELDAEHAIFAERRSHLLRALRAVEQTLLHNESEKTSLLIPVYMLPDDVLKQVFEEIYDHPTSEPCSDSNTPMTIAHVSRRW